MPADRAGIPEREPREDAVLVVDVLTWHLSGLRPELELLHTNRAVGLVADVAVVNLHRRHGLDSGF